MTRLVSNGSLSRKAWNSFDCCGHALRMLPKQFMETGLLKFVEKPLNSVNRTELQACIFLSQRRQWRPTPVLLPGKSHGWRRLVGCGPWGHQELDTTEQLHFHFSLSHIGEGNDNPLQCSCLENPKDREPGGLPSMGSHGVGHD